MEAPPSGTLTINLLQGRDLPVMDMDGSSDPYCIFKIVRSDSKKQQKKRSSTKKKTLFPVWNEEFTFDNVTCADVLEIDIWDEDRLRLDDFMGNIMIPLSLDAVASGEPFWYDLEGSPTAGAIQLSLSFGGADMGQVGNRFKIHKNKMAGLITSLNSGEALRRFSTYDIEIRHVPEVFGETMCHWNVNYPAAQRIFGDHAKGVSLRSALRKQHGKIYREGRGQSDQGRIVSGDQLLNLLGNGVRDGVRRFYTYTLLEDKMLFCETGAPTLVDLMSKHAMHAEAAEEIRYAGEFHIQFDPKNPTNHFLVIDNNSGTYAPPGEHLPLLKEVLQKNFPDLRVEALNHSDPQLKEFTDLVKAENAKNA